MSAQPKSAPAPEFVELRRFSVPDLEPLLAEEGREWESEILWDFTGSADLVRKYAGQRTLDGLAMVRYQLSDPAFLVGRAQPKLLGYGYTVLEDGKGLIGDAFVGVEGRRAFGEVDSVSRLFRHLLDSLISQGARRIETQLMIAHPDLPDAIQRARFIQLYERILMGVDPELPMPPSSRWDPARFRVEFWGPHYEDPTASLLENAYRNHVDARINEQYRTFAGARKFLQNLVSYVGCGEFAQCGSMVAIDTTSGWISGLILSSFVSKDVAHITQLCVARNVRASGLGYELLRRAVGALRAKGARKITLSVTASNTEALRLYERCGFSEIRRFYAFVWERIL